MPFYSIEQTTFVYSLNILYFNNKARIAVILAATKSVIQSQTYIQINTEDILVYIMANVHTPWGTCIHNGKRASSDMCVYRNPTCATCDMPQCLTSAV